MPLELLLQCCTTNILLSPDIEEPGDKVEVAFRRLDSDGDGYIILEDFVHVLIIAIINSTSVDKVEVDSI